MTQSNRIVYLGSEYNLKSRLGLSALINAGQKIALVLSYEAPKYATRAQRLKRAICSQIAGAKSPPSLREIAHSASVEYYKLSSSNLKSQITTVSPYKPDIILSNGWPFKIPSTFYKLASQAALNCHSSYLPEYRGGNVTYAPLINQEKESGVSVHFITDKFDAGMILARKRVPINKFDTPKSLNRRRAEETGSVLIEAIENLDHPEKHLPNSGKEFYQRCSKQTFYRYISTNRLRTLIGLKPHRYKANEPRNARSQKESVIDYWNTEKFSSEISSSSQTPPPLAKFDHQIEVESLSELLRNCQGEELAHCIDIGAGYGRFTPILAHHFDRVTLLEPAHDIFNALKARSKVFKNVDCLELELKDYTTEPPASMILCSGVVYLMDDKSVAELIRRCHKLTTPGGRLILRDFISEPNLTISSVYINGSQCYYRSKEWWHSIAKSNGYEIKDIRLSRSPLRILRKPPIARFLNRIGLLKLLNNKLIARRLNARINRSPQSKHPTCSLILLKRL